MAEIVRYYKEVFVPLYENGEKVNFVNISTLIEASQEWEPVQLNYSDKDESKKNLAAAIIFNFCKTYGTHKAFPINGIVAMTTIILGSIDSEDVVAAQMFVVHIAKRSLDPATFTYHVSNAKEFRIKRVLCEDDKKWIELAQKVHRHKKINELIKDCVNDYCQKTSTDAEVLEDDPIKVTLIESTDPYVRGFSGFEEFFINTFHFQQKIAHFQETVDLLQVVAKMDIIALSVHELAHVNIQKCTNDFNLHSPILAQLNKLSGQQHEFGIYTERKLFSKQVDWFRSALSMNVQKAESFIEATERGSPLPSEYIEGTARRSGSSNADGVDIEYEANIC